MVAWLITLKYLKGRSGKDAGKIILVESCRTTEERMKIIVEQLYAALNFSVEEHLERGKLNGQHSSPARLVRLDGIRSIICGHGKVLWARKVDGLKYRRYRGGKRRLVWKERIAPKGTAPVRS